MYKLNPLTSIEDVNTQIRTFYIDNSSNATQIILRGRFLNKSGRFPSIKNHSNSSYVMVNLNTVALADVRNEIFFYTIEFNEIKTEEDKLPSNPLQSKKQSLKVIIQNLQLTSITNQNQIETSVKNLQMDKNFSMVKKMKSGKEQICQIREENMSLLVLKTIW